METLIINIPEKKRALVKQLLKELGVTFKRTVTEVVEESPNIVTRRTIENAHKGIGIGKPIQDIDAYLDSLQMFVLKPTNQFDKDVKLMKKRSAKNISFIKEFLAKLQIDGVLGIEKKYHPHKLSGNYNNYWEAHIKPDLLIIWFELIEENEIILLRVGTHSDLF